jgi:TetR/AcrR family transcriptional repressor of bet genes
MPKIGAEPARRKAMLEAAIVVIGEAGSLDVTVGQIAKRAGMSPALAHHYFGSKEQIFLDAMRHILAIYGRSIRQNLTGATTPIARLHAIVNASIAPDQFDPEVVAAWLNFYVLALRSAESKRLLQIYARRLHSNLMFNLRPLMDEASAQATAQGMGALIDGFYIRHALQELGPTEIEVRDLVMDYLTLQLARHDKGLE